ncbi:xanthine dehydrogenase accessory protein XdhC [Pseudovibrio exalbescens]|uniref:xanthine dehydrogenase accessory protein XdhC n=1 Tax=Pseudovibrio exalbescens TaxID=197461 RepID=UPI002366371D|nr:xanthine dehydrogenase accessory protein XdhC [Pseudovibrio exalbescens]MDD7908802.1 xanthine dehydrogenase accessory protein XdhC [Pseudovibrio exalbescens]
MNVWQAVSRALSVGKSCALVTISQVRGSAPREVGARMVVHADGHFTGTIGGGQLEYDVIHQAQTLMAKEAIGLHATSFSLGPDLGQCCGGWVEVYIEIVPRVLIGLANELEALEQRGPFSTQAQIREGEPVLREVTQWAPPRVLNLEKGVLKEQFGQAFSQLFLFGAGHVGRSMMLALAPLPFNVQWVDNRRDLFPAHVPSNVSCIHLNDPVNAIASVPADGYVVVMTHDHALDQRLADAALRRNDLAYVGMIGSKTKRARALSRLRSAGLADEQLERLVCPIGIPGISSKQPAQIAASVVAQLLQVADQKQSKERSNFALAKSGTPDQ